MEHASAGELTRWPNLYGGGAGITIGLVGPPDEASRIRGLLSSHWSVVEAWHPGRILTDLPACHALLYVTRDGTYDEADRVAAIEATLKPHAIPIALLAPIRVACDLRASGLRADSVALHPYDRGHVADFVLDAFFRAPLGELGAAITRSPGGDAVVLAGLAALVTGNVHTFRDAAELMTAGVIPFVRLRKHLQLASNAWAPGSFLKAAARDGIDVARFLAHHACLQAAIRYLPGRGYQTAVRLNWKTDTGFRMAVQRQLGVALRDMHRIRLRPLAQDLLNIVASV